MHEVAATWGIALGESSVDFEVAYWTRPDVRTVRHVRDRALRACKSAVEAAGLTIPWPIRTLEWGAAHLPLEGSDGAVSPAGASEGGAAPA